MPRWLNTMCAGLERVTDMVWLHQLFRREGEVCPRQHRQQPADARAVMSSINVSDGIAGLYGGWCPACHHVVTDQVLHAGPGTDVSAEGVAAHSPSIHHGDGERVAARESRASDTEARHHHAVD